jgi:hypothetical protein
MYPNHNTPAATSTRKGSNPRSNTRVYVTLRIVGEVDYIQQVHPVQQRQKAMESQHRGHQLPLSQLPGVHHTNSTPQT